MHLTIGLVTLSPMMVAPVCDIGDPLQLTCTTSLQFVKWSILQANEQGTLEKVTNDVKVTVNQTIQPIRVNSATLIFTRVDQRMPLISTLSIDSVNIHLNGTVVLCSDLAESAMLSASTTIQIIDNNQSELVTLLLSVVKYFI